MANKQKKKKAGGRPSKYETHVKDKLILVEGWARDGLTDEQIAHNLGVAYSTFREYKKKYPALLASLTKGKDVVDRMVENKLFQRAMGYEYTEVTKEMTGVGFIVTKEVTKQVAPDTTAQIFWLKNRRPDVWRDRKDIDHSGSMVINNPMNDLTTEELRKLLAQGDD